MPFRIQDSHFSSKSNSLLRVGLDTGPCCTMVVVNSPLGANAINAAYLDRGHVLLDPANRLSLVARSFPIGRSRRRVRVDHKIAQRRLAWPWCWRSLPVCFGVGIRRQRSKASSAVCDATLSDRNRRLRDPARYRKGRREIGLSRNTNGAILTISSVSWRSPGALGYRVTRDLERSQAAPSQAASVCSGHCDAAAYNEVLLVLQARIPLKRYRFRCHSRSCIRNERMKK